MEQYINKSALIAEIEKIIEEPAPSHDQQCPWEDGYYCGLYKAESIIDTLEVKDENIIKRDWYNQGYLKGRKEANIPARELGLPSELDTIETKEVDLEKEIDKIWNPRFNLGWDEKSLLSMNHEGFTTIAKYFYELGLKTKEE